MYDEIERTLHELAGEVSLCWDPKPTGIFDTTAVRRACQAASIRLKDAVERQGDWSVAAGSVNSRRDGPSLLEWTGNSWVRCAGPRRPLFDQVRSDAYWKAQTGRVRRSFRLFCYAFRVLLGLSS